MNRRNNVEKIKKILEKHYQSQILHFWQQLSDAEKENLSSQIEQLDFSKIDKWIEQYVKNPSAAVLPADFGPVDSYPPEPKNSQQKQKYLQAVNLGQKLISQGKVAGFIVAGGQGTRLDFDDPKGDYRISPVKQKTLFQIFAETIKAVSKRYSATCPWYIMTSPLNHQQTIDIFRSNNFYGLDSSDVFFFQQGTVPNFGFDGKILMADEGQIACSPDGHGGSLKALYKSGAIEDMKKRGVEYISYWQVDNPLVKLFDPLFIGLHVLDNAEMSSKALIKNHFKEKVGNFCLVNGKVTVIEYSDLPDNIAEKKNPDGSLVFELGSIAIHIISRSFVEKLNASGDFSLPFHRAVKKISYIDQKGNLIEPKEPNGIKLETFIFDALPLASNSVILETVRAEEFAPVKNPTGVDSVEVARKMMVERAAFWLESAGVTIPRKSDGSIDCLIEIAPSFALDKDEIKQRLDKIPKINPDDSVYLE
jgi:UDP-N-acetylglucosamine/UDP-N-acetylgalactosamine diphosphorylase